MKTKAETMKFGDLQIMKEHRFPATLILICGILTAGIGFAVLLGWLAGIPLLSTLGSSRIPMAPSAALLFMLYGAGMFLLSRPSLTSAALRISMVIGATGTMAAVLLLILSFLGIHPKAEHLGIRIVETFNGQQTGHLSPVSAFCFVLVGLSFLASLSSSTGRTKATSAAFWLSVLVVLSSLVLLLAYILGSPLLYGSRVIPPSLPTSLAFLLIGAALLVYSGQRLLPHSSLSEMTDTRAVYALLMIFLLLVAGIVTAGYLYLRNYEQEYRMGVEDQLSSVARLKVNGLEQYRKERFGDAFLIFKNDQFSDLVRNFLANPEDAQGRIRLHAWLKKLQDYYKYNEVRLLDAGGITRLSAPAGLRSVSAVIAQRVSDVLRTREIAFQDFYFNEDDHRPYLSLLVPILGTRKDKRAIGVVTLRIDPETFLYPFISLWPSASRTAETLIIRREGSDALFLNDLRFRKNTALTLRIPLERKEVVSVQAALGRNGIVEGFDYAGVPVVADVRAVPDSPWMLIARMNSEEMYAPLRRQLWTILALVSALLIGAGAGVAFLWRQQHVRFYRERYESAEVLRKSEERYRVLFNTMDEGFCVVEMLYDPAGKAIDYRFVESNPAFEKQTGLQQALGKTIREMVPDHETYWFEIFGNVARTGEAVRFEKPAQGLQKDFDVFAFRLGGDESRHVAILFKDITEQKLAEKELLRYSSELAKKNKELRESEKEFRNLVEEAPLAISVVSKEGEIEYINRKNIEIIGYTRYEAPTLESWWSLAYPDPEERKKITALWGNIQRRVLSGENIGITERMITCKDGTTKDVELRFSRAGDKVLVIFNDITARNRAEEELQRYSSEIEKSNKELQEALVNVKTLSGMLPICASCKKIRDDKGYWSGVESYITRHSEVLFSHGICPECEKKMYEELEKLKKGNF